MLCHGKSLFSALALALIIPFYGTYQLGTDGQMIIDGLERGEYKYQRYSLDSGGESWVNGVASLQFTEKNAFSGMFQNDASQEGELQSHYSVETVGKWTGFW